MEKKKYHSPVVVSEVVFSVEGFGDISLLARCWGLSSPNADGSYSHAAGGCKD